MIVSKTHKQVKPNIAVVSQPSVPTAAMMADTIPSQESTSIRDRAYELVPLSHLRTRTNPEQIKQPPNRNSDKDVRPSPQDPLQHASLV
jgi:hypothetical protein